jgi:hypothetical protein
MNKLQKEAKYFLSIGLNPVPVGKDTKEPDRPKWSTVRFEEDEITEYPFDNIGIATGSMSGGLEAIDFDLKNAEYPDEVMKLFKKKVSLSLMKKLVVQQTISGGFHMIYRCEDITSSKKLAMNKTGQAVIETRGEGGYIKCAPSEGYKLIQGSWDKIPIITPEERLQIFISAKMLNQQLLKEAGKKRSREDNDYLKKFPDYNEDIEIGVELLEAAGWTQHSEDAVWINFSRPDSKSNDLHGGYNKEGKFFWAFSTAQSDFETERPYNNHAIFAELECGGNYPKAYAKLYEMGYGNPEEKGKKVSKEESEDEDWDQTLEDLSFLSDEIEENEYIDQAVKGEIAQGLPTGWPALDPYFRLKDHSLNIGLGLDNVGKSVYMLNIAAASATLHGWKWGMVMPENKTPRSRIRLIEILSGKPITYFKYKPEEKKFYVNYSRENFKIISNKKHYSIDDVLEMGKRMYEKFGIDALLIDPYNFFKVTGDGYRFNNEMLSKMRVFAEKYCSVYILAHPSTNSPRANKDSAGYIGKPSKYDIQGGADFPYRVDDFFTVHRIVNHEDPDVRKEMQVSVEKIKEVETGGKVHDNGDYTGLIYETRHGFTGYWDKDGNNPFFAKLNSKKEVQAQVKRMNPEDAF